MPSNRRCLVGIAAVAALGACQPSTTRPGLVPLPEAAASEIWLSIPEATRQLAEALRADSIPVIKVQPRDGYLESSWFESATGRRVTRRPMGPDVVRVRAWIDPSRPRASTITVETAYRPLADPSLPERELERSVPNDHPVAVKIRATLERMVKRYGSPSPPPEPPAAAPVPVPTTAPAPLSASPLN